MKRLLLIVGLLLIFGAAIFAGPMLFEAGQFVYHARKLEIEAKSKVNSLTVARIDKIIRDSERLSKVPSQWQMKYNGEIPVEFSDLSPSWVAIDPNQIMIEFLGGFDHVGIVARRSDSGQWHLYRYNEEQETLLR